jgi:hypothetical protein
MHITTNMETIKRRPSAILSPSPVPFEDVKHVRFEEYVTLSPSSAPIELLESYDEMADIWYTMEDLLSFRNEARETCRQMRLLETVDAIDTIKAPMMARDSLTRGLEQRTCSERQRRKYLTTRLIVKAAKKLSNDPEKLAALASKCTAWASTLAVEEAARDHARATSVSSSRKSSLKRRLSSDEPHMPTSRRVKPHPTLIPPL